MPYDQSGAVLRHLRTIFVRQAAEHSSDAELLARFVERRDEAAFAALVERHGGLVLQVCGRVVGGGHDADDAFQATFLVLAKKAAAIRKRTSLAAWLHGVALRSAMNLRKSAMRRTRHERTAPPSSAPVSPSPAAVASLSELECILDEEVQSLPEHHRAAFVVCCLEGHSRKAAAQTLGCNEGTLASRLAKARELLQKRLLARGVALSATLGAVALAPNGLSAAVPASLAHRTVDAALAFAAGDAAGLVSSNVLAVAQSVLKGMLMAKLKSVVMLLLAASLTVVAGGGLVIASGGDMPTKVAAVNDSPQVVAREPKNANPVDHSDNALPHGAAVQLGTNRFRHEGEAERLVYSPNGKWIIAHMNTGVAVWDASTGLERYTLPPPERNGPGSGTGVAISPDGSMIATPAMKSAIAGEMGRANVITLWDISTGKPLRSLSAAVEAHQCQILELQFSRDGKYLAASHLASKVVVFEVATGKEGPPLEGVGGRVGCHNFAISPDGKTLAAGVTDFSNGSQDVSVRLWDLATGKSLRVHHEFADAKANNFVRAITFSGDGKTLAFSTIDQIILSDPASGAKTGLLQAKMGQVVNLAFTSDDKFLFSGGESEGKVRRWELATGQSIVFAKGGGPFFGRSMALSPDGKTVALGTSGKTIRLWDADTGEEKTAGPQSHDTAVTCLTVSPDGKTLISAGNDGHILWDTARWQPTGKLPGSAASVAFSLDGKRLVSTTHSPKVRIWDWAGERKSTTIAVPETSRTPLAAFSADGSKLLTLDWKFERPGWYRLVRWDLASGNQESAADAPHVTYRIFFSPDGRTIFADSGEDGIAVRDVASGQTRVLRMDSHIRSFACSPDGRVLATGSRGPQASLRLTEVATGQSLFAIGGHRGSIDAIAWSPNGRLVATGDDGDRPGTVRSIRLWDAADGRELTVFDRLTSNVSALTFTPDGATLIAGFSNGILLTFDVAKDVPRPAAKLSDAELEAYWADLSADTARAHRAIGALVDSPRLAAPMLRSRLAPVPVADAPTLRRIIADLDSATFAVREAATKQLKALGEQAEPGMRAALKEELPLETRRRLKQLLDDAAGPETLRSLRAIAVLERMASADALGVLETLAKGLAGVRTTEDAAAFLTRLRAKALANP
jgi:RNA polymerase sigma factor (sigma-70 family)